MYCFADETLMSAVAPLNDQSIKILRLPQVCDLTGLGRSMIYQMEADKRFPELFTHLVFQQECYPQSTRRDCQVMWNPEPAF